MPQLCGRRSWKDGEDEGAGGRQQIAHKILETHAYILADVDALMYSVGASGFFLIACGWLCADE